MDNPAQASDLTKRGWTGDATVAQTRLDEAWRALRREVPSLEARLDTGGDLDTDDVIDVVAAAALRVLRNPDGYVSASAAVDDYNESWNLADSTQDLYFTSAELRRLAPPAYGAGSVAYGFC